MNTVPLPGGSTGAGAEGWKVSFPMRKSLASCCCFLSISQGGNMLGKILTRCPYKVRNLFLKPWNRPSVQFSRSVVSDSLWPHGLQHTRPPCPSPTLELTQTHVHWLSDAIQPSHPLLFPSLPAFSLSQHQGLFLWVSSSHQVVKVLVSVSASVLQWIFRTDFLWMDWLDLLAVQGTSRVFNTTVQIYQFFGAQLSL